MAKVTGALFSLSASGKFAEAIVFTAWKGRQVVRQLVTPANPKSADQVAQRNMVRATGVAQHWANLTVEKGAGRLKTDKELLTELAPAGQAWNGFLNKAMIGAGSTIYDAAAAAWAALTAGEKTAWDTAAGGLAPIYPATNQEIAGGATGTPLTAGQGFYHYQYGLYNAGVAAVPPSAVPPVYA